MAARGNISCVLVGFFLVGCSTEPPAGLVGKFGFREIAFVERPHAPHAGSPLCDPGFQAGGDARLLRTAAPGGAVDSLTGLLGGDVRGLDISPDGRRAVIGLSTGPEDRYHVVEIDLEARRNGQACALPNGDLGPACRRLTFGPADDLEPFYLADGRVAFLRIDPDGPVDFLGRGRVQALWAVELDGTAPTRLSALDGRLLGARSQPDGRVLAVAWLSRDGAAHLQVLSLEPVGAGDLGVDGPRLEADSLPLGPVRDARGLVLATCTALGGTFGAGGPCVRLPDGTWVPALSGAPLGAGCAPEGRVRDLEPLADEFWLAAFVRIPGGCTNASDEAAGRVPDFGLALIDRRDGRRYPLRSDAGLDEIQPRPVRQRSLLDPGVRLPARPEFGCEQPGVRLEGFVDEGNRSAGAVGLRVLEGLSGALAPWDMSLGGIEPAAVCGGDADQDGRVDTWVAPLEADGSFSLTAPARVPLRLQAVDRYGAALGRDPLWRSGPDCARRTCGACHANDGQAAGFAGSLAAARPPSRLDAPPQLRRDVDFRADIQPLLRRSCALGGCHDATTAAGIHVGLDGRLVGLDLSDEPSGRFTTAYQNLLQVEVRRESSTGRVLETRRPYLKPGHARESRLLQRLGVPCRFQCAGAPAWAPWGVGFERRHPEDQGGGAALSDEERWLLVDWVDAGAPFHGREAVP